MLSSQLIDSSCWLVDLKEGPPIVSGSLRLKVRAVYIYFSFKSFATSLSLCLQLMLTTIRWWLQLSWSLTMPSSQAGLSWMLKFVTIFVVMLAFIFFFLIF